MTGAPARSGGRLLALCCVAFGLAAAGLWTASALPWWHTTAIRPLRAPTPVSFTGREVWPVLVGLAPVALAGVAGVLAVAGWPRRLLGGLLAVLGGWVVVRGLVAVFGAPPAPHDPGYPTPPTGIDLDALRDQPVVVTAAPWLAVAGGLAVLAGGACVLLREPVLPRLGARFRVGHDRPRRPDQEADWWGALDEGRDPTSSGAPGADPRPPD